ncbi:MAG TPA: hypothetical protein VN620_03790, partial [Candidatus Methylomirabilis sp.]|nr:hypothetical protein [Candidatus Methylomirabilis sp.]
LSPAEPRYQDVLRGVPASSSRPEVGDIRAKVGPAAELRHRPADFGFQAWQQRGVLRPAE